MKHITLHYALVAAACVLTVVGGGCQQRADNAGQPAATPRSADLKPEESFELIVETFRRGVQDVPIGFVVQEAGGHTMMTGQNKVSHELIPPANEGDRYRGIITVVSESRYSIQRPIDGSDEEPAKEGAASSPPSESTSGVQIFDSSLVGAPDAEGQDASPAPSKPDNGKVTVARKRHTQERKYELVYESGRWVLTTKLDRNTEKSIEYAFDRALKTQT